MASASESIRTPGGLAFLGDLMLGRHIQPAIHQRGGLAAMLEPLRELTQGRQLVANLECPLCPPPQTAATQPSRFHALPAMAEELAAAGFSVLSIGNNHMFDCGVEGMRETRSALERAGIRYMGAGLSRDEAANGVSILVNGYTVGFVAFSFVPPARVATPGVAYLYDDTVDLAIGQLRPRVDFLVAMPHAGIELYEFPLFRDQKIYRRMIDLGVDCVIGSQAHCIQAKEVYQDKHIYYSLGDCLFDHHEPEVWEEFLSPAGHVSRFGLKVGRSLPFDSLVLLMDFVDGNILVRHEPITVRRGVHLEPLRDDARHSALANFDELGRRLQSGGDLDRERIVIEEALLASLRQRRVI